MSDKRLNGYYLYYKNFLRIQNLSPEQLVIEMQNRFGDETQIRIGDWGRSKIFKSINIRKDGLSEYVIPLHTPEEILGLHKTMGQRLLEDYSWVTPPYIMMRTIYEMISKTKIDDLEDLYKATYDSVYFSSQLTSTYREIPLFQKYLPLIEEVIECFLLRKIAGSITLLLTIIEGIAREFCDSLLLKYNKQGSRNAFETAVRFRKEHWRDNVLLFDYQNKIKIIIPDDYLIDEILIKVDEAMDMFVSFEKYGLDYLYKSGSKFSLNRHSILHGYNREYYIPVNFFRLFSCLEMMAVVVSENLMPKDINEHITTFQTLTRFQFLDKISKLIH